ncbi:M23 family metallopeptidase [Methylobacterium komagatae]|uniref:M23 family metallopeptidase n=1 Tax=Methylobacterium komagatae TaxID=374425 RepID=A0ABW2BN03_9HYPH
MTRTTPQDRQERAPRRLGPWLGAGLAVSLLWSGASTYLVLFRDEALGRIVSGQMAMRNAYEARIATLQEKIDGVRAEGAEAQADIGARLRAALARQTELERRQAALSGLLDTAATGSLPATARAYAPPAGRTPPLTGFELRQDDPAEAAQPWPDRRSALDPKNNLNPKNSLDAEDGLLRLEARLGGLEEAQGAELGRIARSAETGINRMRAVIARVGLDPSRLLPRVSAEGIGGPLVPIGAGGIERYGFDGGMTLVGRLIGQGQRLRQLVDELPLRKPLAGSVSLSSPFGPRLDPFTRGLALHTGLDFKAESGEPARATAPGVITEAEWAGGYGNMVGIDHGHGLATRFGHLARIAVRPGQRVAAGEIIGYVGSTGRSTGSHLHYETRIEGEPVDPQRFLDAGRVLDAPRMSGG